MFKSFIKKLIPYSEIRESLERKNKRIKQFIYPNYDIDTLLTKLKSMGVKKGSHIFIHSSWNEFYNFTGTPTQLIKALIELVGPEGTLAMPAFPSWDFQQSENPIFNVKKTASAAGLLTEFFRRFPNVKRSINLNHSVCAVGKHADFLTKDHHLSETSWDKQSPYYRLLEIDATIIGLGVGHNLEICTCLHCVESLLKDEIYYFSALFKKQITYNYIDNDGNTGTHTFLQRDLNSALNTKKVAKHFSRKTLGETQLSNLKIYSVPARTVIEQAVELGKKGITMYENPIPHKSLFYKL